VNEEPDQRLSSPLDREDAVLEPPKVDPDAPPARPNADEPVEEDESLKKQGDKLSDGECLR
jgi:hypothetical protein